MHGTDALKVMLDCWDKGVAGNDKPRSIHICTVASIDHKEPSTMRSASAVRNMFAIIWLGVGIAIWSRIILMMVGVDY